MSKEGFFKGKGMGPCALCLLACALCLALFTGGCGRRNTVGPERQGFFFDTSVSIRLGAGEPGSLLDECFELCAQLEKVLSPTDEESELYRLNHRTEASVSVSDALRDCIQVALDYSVLTQGRFDLTIRPVSELWDFHSGKGAVPEAGVLKAVAAKVDYRSVSLEGNEVRFTSPDTRIDLGAVAKGYISGRLAELLRERGCRSALINLGGNVRAVGRKSPDAKWTVGIQKPFAPHGEVSLILEAEDECVISSGIYERYFEADGVRYHHILDPLTGMPADCPYEQVTVTGTSDADCDALATVALLCGREEAERAARARGLQVSILVTGEEEPADEKD